MRVTCVLYSRRKARRIEVDANPTLREEISLRDLDLRPAFGRPRLVERLLTRAGAGGRSGRARGRFLSASCRLRRRAHLSLRRLACRPAERLPLRGRALSLRPRLWSAADGVPAVRHAAWSVRADAMSSVPRAILWDVMDTLVRDPPRPKMKPPSVLTRQACSNDATLSSSEGARSASAALKFIGLRYISAGLERLI